MPQPKGRDLDEARHQLVRWLESRLPDAGDLRVSDLRGPKDTGFSSDTLMFDLDYTEASGMEQHRELVIRLDPVAEFGVFPEYDVALQFKMMRALANTAVPRPQMLWLEEDPGAFGAQFYVMERVDGQVPSDSPPYHSEGWICELSPADREKLWTSGLDAMAEVHKLDFAAPWLDFLPRPSTGVSPIQAQMDYWQRYIDWGMDRSRYDLINKGFEWLCANQPVNEPVGVCWGDARISNQIFRDCEVVAVIDWEMVFIGNPVADLAWFITMDRVFTDGIGLERLAGFPDPAASIAHWERRVGRSADHFAYYEVFAAWRFACIMARVFLQMKFYEILPEEAQVDVENLSTPVLEALLAGVGA
ncbi:MAG: phosphotransferase family protein [Deltaproteobacteria bacterium]|nr:phosphotransferase family protein [Deltaproteobacteria bacterium]MBW2384266.1 phosphotransferase family protein [Deltaproteobacteria bacterium]MBW2695894.1 phosphotransferase family protein [Deltaproteobacteria bacterium]